MSDDNKETGNSEYVILVDEQDNAIGTEEKLKAHEEGLLHRAFSVFLFRKKGPVELLLQQREKNKYHCGGLWANSCCSHPRQNESITEAASRRLQEELGIGAQLEPVGSFQYKAVFANGLTEHERDHVVVGVFDSESIPFNTAEVEAVRWISLAHLEDELNRNPEQFTPWFNLALKVALKHVPVH